MTRSRSLPRHGLPILGATVLVLFLTLAISVPAQGPEAAQEEASGHKVPLVLYINGPGRVLPFHDGQLLNPEQNYNITAIPNPGATFTGWNRVDVFTIIQIEVDTGGTGGHPTTNTVKSVLVNPEPGLILRKTMSFQAVPPRVLYNTNGNSLTRSTGWQANFVERRWN